MIDQEDLNAWDRMEAAGAGSQQARANRIRCHGYFIACSRIADDAKREVDRRVELLARAQKAAEQALTLLRMELSWTEFIGRVITSEDAQSENDLALLLEHEIG